MAPSQFPVASISFQRLVAGDRQESNRLFEACTGSGVFMLQLNDHESIFDKARGAFSVSEQVMDLPLEQKMSWEMDQWGLLQIGGYKPAGKHAGVLRDNKDNFENFLVPYDAIWERDKRHPAWPLPVRQNQTQLQQFQLSCRHVCTQLLARLTQELEGQQSHQGDLVNYHREDMLSTTSLALLKYLPRSALDTKQLGHMAHTDVGSLTLLFTDSPGLQVYTETTNRWFDVTPEPGAVVVNVGDTLSFLSSGIFKSCLHRVVPVIDESSGLSKTRYSMAYFQRPELDATFFDTNGNKWTGRDWHCTKYKVFRADNLEQSGSELLTGRKGFLGQFEKV